MRTTFRTRLALGLGGLAAIGATILVFAAAGFGQSDNKFSLKSADRVSDIVRTPQDNFLVLKAEGSSVAVVRLDENSGAQISEGRFTAQGTVDYLKLASQSTSGLDGRTMGVAVSCPGGFGGEADDGQAEESEFRICPREPVWESFEIDDRGNVGDSQIVPNGASGFLLASDSYFVIASGLLYKDGTWQQIQTPAPGRTGDAWISCATDRHLYALYGNPGPRTATGVDSVTPNPNPNYGLYRYELDGSLDNEWTEVQILGLKDATAAFVGCSVDAAVVQVDSTFVSTMAPDKPIELPGKASSLLPNIPSKRPVITYLMPPTGETTGARRCAIIEESSRQVHSASRDVCYGVAWRTGDEEFVAVLGVGRSDIELRKW